MLKQTKLPWTLPTCSPTAPDLIDACTSDLIDAPILPMPMTSDECIAMCESQQKTDYLFYGSLAVNALLLVTTSISEIMSACKCEATGVFDGIVLVAKKARSWRTNSKPKNTPDEEAVNLSNLNPTTPTTESFTIEEVVCYAKYLISVTSQPI